MKIHPLEAGEKAPDFYYKTRQGTTKSTENLRGTSYVVYFYPRDNTPGCTKEACAFRDHYQAFKDAGIEVIGVSTDSESSHDKFRLKHELPFALAADTDKKIVKGFGVWGEKKFMGKVSEGTHRITFIIDKTGIIQKNYPKIKPSEHAAQLLEEISHKSTPCPQNQNHLYL